MFPARPIRLESETRPEFSELVTWTSESMCEVTECSKVGQVARSMGAVPKKVRFPPLLGGSRGGCSSRGRIHVFCHLRIQNAISPWRRGYVRQLMGASRRTAYEQSATFAWIIFRARVRAPVNLPRQKFESCWLPQGHRSGLELSQALSL